MKGMGTLKWKKGGGESRTCSNSVFLFPPCHTNFFLEIGFFACSLRFIPGSCRSITIWALCTFSNYSGPNLTVMLDIPFFHILYSIHRQILSSLPFIYIQHPSNSHHIHCYHVHLAWATVISCLEYCNGFQMEFLASTLDTPDPYKLFLKLQESERVRTSEIQRQIYCETNEA